MWLEFSHIIAFSTLFISSLFDVFSEKGDVPSIFMLTGIVSGIILHSLYALSVGGFNSFLWMLGVGLSFSAFGWFSYWFGIWGGADAMALTVLGFAAPYSVSGIGVLHGLSLFVNIFLVSSVYVVLFTFYMGMKSETLRSSFKQRLKDEWISFTVILGLVGVLSVFQSSMLSSVLMFFGFSVLILLFFLSRDLEDTVMSQAVPIDEVETGDVIDTEEIDIGGKRERNLFGKLFEQLDSKLNGVLSKSFLGRLDESMGYSEVVGVTEEELGYLKDEGVGELQVLEGLRLVPVFPAALVLTDAGFTFLLLFSFL